MEVESAIELDYVVIVFMKAIVLYWSIFQQKRSNLFSWILQLNIVKSVKFTCFGNIILAICMLGDMKSAGF